MYINQLVRYKPNNELGIIHSFSGKETYAFVRYFTNHSLQEIPKLTSMKDLEETQLPGVDTLLTDALVVLNQKLIKAIEEQNYMEASKYGICIKCIEDLCKTMT